MKTKITAIFLTAVMLLGLGGCADTSYALSANGSQVRAGEYIYAQLKAAQSAVSSFTASNPDVDITQSSFNLFNLEIEEIEFEKWVNREALRICAENKACSELFDELGLTLTALEEQEISASVNSTWSTEVSSFESIGLKFKTWGEFYESVGIGKSSITEISIIAEKAERIFMKYYGEDGLEAVPEEEIKNKFSEEYARYRYIPLSLLDDEDNKITDEAELKAIEDRANDYVTRLSGGESIITVADDYIAYLNEKQNVLEPEAEPEENEEEQEEEKEEDYDWITYMDNENYLPLDVNNHIFEMQVGTVELFKTEDTYYVLARLDINEREDWLEEQRNYLLYLLRDAEMKEKMKERTDKVVVQVNQAAIDRYKLEKVAIKEILA